MHRRKFVASLLATAAILPSRAGRAYARRGGLAPAESAQPAVAGGRRLRILMLGGTNYVGPHLVQNALERGHEVTLFNRGVTNTHLFTELEKLRGNRYPDRGEGLAALETDRTWDVVLDTWQQAPGCVDLTTRMFADRAERYVYISSVAAFRNYRERGMTEDGPLLDATEYIDSFEHPGPGYSMRKRAAEQAVERLGEQGIILRCTSVQGYGGFSLEPNPEAGYWPYRFLVGEPLLAPDDPTSAFQLIDVKDLARFAVRAVENGFGGTFNMVGPEEPLTLPEYLRAWGEATDHRSTIVWADPDWLIEQGVRPWEDIRNWIPGDEAEPGFYWISNRRALEHGLTYRPLAATLRDVVASNRTCPADLRLAGPGISRERELEVIEAWRAAARRS